MHSKTTTGETKIGLFEGRVARFVSFGRDGDGAFEFATGSAICSRFFRPVKGEMRMVYGSVRLYTCER